jgi:CRP/FNR family transcriptional regulator, cyclic AMP receptor protein
VDRKVELISQVPLFARCSKQELQELASAADEIDLPEGKVLTREGDRGREFFVLLDGTAEVKQGGKTIRTLGPGDFLGEIALLDGGPRTATATAVTDSRLLSLEHQAFDDLMDSSPAIRSAVMEAVGQRLRAIDEETPI